MAGADAWKHHPKTTRRPPRTSVVTWLLLLALVVTALPAAVAAPPASKGAPAKDDTDPHQTKIERKPPARTDADDVSFTYRPSRDPVSRRWSPVGVAWDPAHLNTN